MSATPRPPQVTLAGGVIMAGSVAVVVGAFDRVSKLHSLELRTQVQHELSPGWIKDAGVGVDQVLSMMHVMALVAAGCATAAAILGWYVLRGSRSARLAVSILAVPILVAGLDSASVFALLVAAAAAALWTPSARAWFRDASSLGSSTQGFRDASSLGSSTQGLSGDPIRTPSAQRPDGDAATPAAGTEPPSGPPAPSGVPLPPAPERARPGGVLTAALLTWIFSGLTLLGLGAALAYTLANPGDLWRTALDREPSLADQGVTQHYVVVAMCVLLGVLGLLCVAAMVVAVFVVRRAPWARVTLIVLAAIGAGFLLLATLGTGVAVVPLAAAGVTIALLARHDVARWFDPR